jgi:hypothetical protein
VLDGGTPAVGLGVPAHAAAARGGAPSGGPWAIPGSQELGHRAHLTRSRMSAARWPTPGPPPRRSLLLQSFPSGATAQAAQASARAQNSQPRGSPALQA